MKFDIYGRFLLEIVRENDRWTAFHPGEGTRRPAGDIVIPAELDAAELESYLDDAFHELAAPGQVIRRID